MGKRRIDIEFSTTLQTLGAPFSAFLLVVLHFTPPVKKTNPPFGGLRLLAYYPPFYHYLSWVIEVFFCIFRQWRAEVPEHRSTARGRSDRNVWSLWLG